MDCHFQDIYTQEEQEMVIEKMFNYFHLWAGVCACSSWLFLPLCDRGGGGLRSLSALLVWFILYQHQPFGSYWDNHDFNLTLIDFGLEMTIHQRLQGSMTGDRHYSDHPSHYVTP